MTALTLAYKRIAPSFLQIRLAAAKERFYELNKRGILTFLLLWMICVLATGYLGALYLTFKVGFETQESVKLAAEHEEDVLKLELRVQELRGGLVLANEVILESMEGISAIKYLKQESFTASVSQGARP